ncbi:MAG: Holliday junction resolvase RuvX [Chloroflexota bacterium]
MTLCCQEPLAGRILALDVGERRIGVAVSDETRTLARSLMVLNRHSREKDSDVLARLILEQSAVMVVIGLPLVADGSEGSQAQRIRRYAQGLQNALAVREVRLPIVFHDESFSTVDATQAMIQGGRKRRQRRQRLDAVAAAVILQSYLDQHSQDKFT